MLFAEIQYTLSYSVNVYGSVRAPDFMTVRVVSTIQSVVEGSLVSRRLRPASPASRNAEGGWDTTPHRARIQRNRHDQLKLWHALMESG